MALQQCPFLPDMPDAIDCVTALQSFVHTSDLRMTSKQFIYKQQIQYKAMHIDSLYVNGCAGVSHVGQVPQGEGLPPHAPQACGPGKEQAHT